MMRCQLPVRSLLYLSTILLMLSPGLPLLNTGMHDIPPTEEPLSDEDQEAVLGFALQQYRLQADCIHASYFKQLNILKAEKLCQEGVYECRLTVELVKTACRRKVGKMTYHQIQECPRLPGNHPKPICYFQIRPCSLPNEMALVNSSCD